MRLLQVKPSVALLVMLMALLAVAFAAAPAEAQSTVNGKYDTDGDRLIEITYLEQLAAMKADDDGNAQVDSGLGQFWKDYYADAFPLDDGERVCFRTCRGYELDRSLDFYDPGHYRSGEVNPDWISDDGWVPGHGLSATFEGNGYTISGLLINRPETDFVGLFGATAAGSRISDVGLVNVDVSGKYKVGALVGENRGDVTGSYATGAVTGRNQVGGLVGYARSTSTIERSQAEVEVKGIGVSIGAGDVGGLVGENNGPVKASFATGDVIGANWTVGGLIGKNGAPLTAVYATGDVKGDAWVGGLVGNNHGPISVAYATGNVNGRDRVGGLVATIEGPAADLTAVYATGNVTSTGTRTGGRVGGLVGRSAGSGAFVRHGSISNSYTVAPVSTADHAGALIGTGASNQVRSSYWNLDIIAWDSRDGYGEGKTTAELQGPTSNAGIYAGWSSRNWDFGDSSQYPALKADMNGDGIATAGEFGVQHGRTPDPSCTRGSIAVGSEVTGRWMGHCGSVSRPGSYALYYTLNLSTESEVIITLESEDVDTYLFLLEGSGTSGEIRHKNDDYIGGGSDSRIHETLAAGTYTIEAATYGDREPGSFNLTVEPGQGTPREPSSHCVSGVAVDGGAVAGSWSADCPSVNTEGSYARYYAFSLSEESEVSITLESDDADTYLFLLEDFGTSGAVLHKDDDYPGGGTDSQVKETLPAGNYTIEATTYDEETTGGFTLSVETVEEPGEPGPPGPGPVPPPDTGCVETVAEDGTVSGQWASGCESANQPGSYARYYSFTLSEESEVTITLELTSGDADTYLNLLSGAGTDGSVLHSNDDDGGTARSRIQETLDAGTYTVEATTYEAGQTGSFTLTVEGLGDDGTPIAAGCVETLERDGIRSGSWAAGCDSAVSERGYARYYTFTLTEEKEVTIILESSEADAYLYLRDGDARSGEPLYEDDDGAGRPNSQIRETLPAGTYTIEATTYDAGETGGFTLTVSGL